MDDFPVSRRRRFGRILDVTTVVVLSITAVLTAWCGFEASKWGGEMSIAFSQASSARVQAAAAASEAQAARQYDLTIYTQWVLAEHSGDASLMRFIEERFSPQFTVAFDAWRKSDRDALGPAAMKEYVLPGAVEAKELSARADAKFSDALAFNQRGDNYSLMTVLFALVLFFAALSQSQKVEWRRWTFLILGLLLGIVGVAFVSTFPIKI
ncbi:hypothetical protein [Microbacterium sp. H1-D42]|uniref:hypothetical protein n=1 Tax=Microbacterium sp. H1-D42 TaxID=2925844 RepID=UPI001F53A38E|nr:hypothetical protein [Microbacterium sp. H1-D42]UNK72362.1 hypothetical protein MNR00_07965 [Microbacterium sp. H1-D42]